MIQSELSTKSSNFHFNNPKQSNLFWSPILLFPQNTKWGSSTIKHTLQDQRVVRIKLTQQRKTKKCTESSIRTLNTRLFSLQVMNNWSQVRNSFSSTSSSIHKSTKCLVKETITPQFSKYYMNPKKQKKCKKRRIHMTTRENNWNGLGLY